MVVIRLTAFRETLQRERRKAGYPDYPEIEIMSRWYAMLNHYLLRWEEYEALINRFGEGNVECPSQRLKTLRDLQEIKKRGSRASNENLIRQNT